jgi:hypothetical protein
LGACAEGNDDDGRDQEGRPISGLSACRSGNATLLIAHQLYPPEAWANDVARRTKATLSSIATSIFPANSICGSQADDDISSPEQFGNIVAI